MAYQIVFEAEAEAQFRALTAKERKTVMIAIVAKLVQQPTVETHAVKRLRPNPVAEYQLGVGNLRLLYNVGGDRVILLVIGRKKSETS
jgi:mRNA interferase RelE/StbE